MKQELGRTLKPRPKYASFRRLASAALGQASGANSGAVLDPRKQPNLPGDVAAGMHAIQDGLEQRKQGKTEGAHSMNHSTATMTCVRGYFPRAQKVYLLGPFNRWSTTATPMSCSDDGEWCADLPDSDAYNLSCFVWHAGNKCGRLVRCQPVEVSAQPAFKERPAGACTVSATVVDRACDHR